MNSARDSAFRVRILGIKAFDPTAQEAGISLFGQLAVAFLTEYKGTRAILEFKKFAKDPQGRLLAYVRVGEHDLGETLLERGLALTYVRYPVEREDHYQAAQGRAIAENEGLWSSKRAADRARSLLASWEAARDD